MTDVQIKCSDLMQLSEVAQELLIRDTSFQFISEDNSIYLKLDTPSWLFPMLTRMEYTAIEYVAYGGFKYNHRGEAISDDNS